MANIVLLERGRRGWTQAQVAAAAGVDQTTVRRAERRNARIRADTAFALAKALALDPCDLMPRVREVERDAVNPGACRLPRIG